MRIASEDATKQRRPLGEGVDSGNKGKTLHFPFAFWSQLWIQAVRARKLENSCMQGRSIAAREAGASYVYVYEHNCKAD